MSAELSVRNRQRVRAVDTRLLHRVLQCLLRELAQAREFDLTIHLVNALEMSSLNQTHMRHAGSTDVITLDYGSGPGAVTGEIFVCVDEAALQARRFRTTWQAELTRYLVHGVLHLRGHDDRRPAARLRMKREEGRLLKELDRRFRLSKLRRKPRVTA